jgi:hypothetical protein
MVRAREVRADMPEVVVVTKDGGPGKERDPCESRGLG